MKPILIVLLCAQVIYSQDFLEFVPERVMLKKTHNAPDTITNIRYKKMHDMSLQQEEYVKRIQDIVMLRLDLRYRKENITHDDGTLLFLMQEYKKSILDIQREKDTYIKQSKKILKRLEKTNPSSAEYNNLKIFLHVLENRFDFRSFVEY